ncbi:hypothetical protein C8Q80DRAFT_1154326 [Daedaleopsis nitida]|nr:hypothetical protein C8Q80DRAFT_1154326 [Daedaleopsis nitida]
MASSSQRENHEHTDPAMAPWSFSSADRSHPGEHTRTPGGTLLIFAAILTPLAILPYALTRRQYAALRTELTALRKANTSLVRELRATAEETAKRHGETSSRALELLNENRALLTEQKASVLAKEKVVEEHRKRLEAQLNARIGELGTAVKDIRRGTDALLHELKNSVNVMVAVAKEREEKDKKFRVRTDNSLKELVDDVRRGQAEVDAVKGMWKPLADVAAFMEEVELRQGWTPRPGDGRGIESMRHLAQRLQQVAGSLDSTRDPEA